MLSARSVKCFASWARSCLNFACSSGVNVLNSASVSKASVCGSLIGVDASASTSLPHFATSRFRFHCRVTDAFVDPWLQSIEPISVLDLCQ